MTYNDTGYPMVRQAREMVRTSAIGTVRKLIVEYHQGWLATQLESAHNKQADWRTDPARSSIVGAIGDIGLHAENLAFERHRPGDRKPVRRPDKLRATPPPRRRRQPAVAIRKGARVAC